VAFHSFKGKCLLTREDPKKRKNEGKGRKEEGKEVD